MSPTLTFYVTFVPASKLLLGLNSIGTCIKLALSVEVSAFSVPSSSSSSSSSHYSKKYNRGYSRREHSFRVTDMSVELRVVLLPVPGMWDPGYV